MKELVTDAIVENATEVIDFVASELKALGCSKSIIVQMSITIDEIFSNISYYAYGPDTGTATVRTEILNNPLRVVVTFFDRGKPFNPLAKADPDINVSVEEAEIGGLGIYLVKKNMDEVRYEYIDGQNVFTIVKNL